MKTKSIYNRALLYLKHLVLVFTVFFGFTSKTSAEVVKETKSGYYMLFDANDLLWFAEQVNAGNDTICGRLYNDIYLSSLEKSYWTPIGCKLDEPFKGKFDGNNKTIYGLTVCVKNQSGLFGGVKNATIENVNIESPNVALVSLPNIYGMVGALCGEADSSVISNCHVTNANLNFTINDVVSNPSYVGGVCGYLTNESRMVNCSVSGIVRSLKDYVGGVVGAIKLSEIDSCSVFVGDSLTTIFAESNAGGIAGTVYDRSIAASIKNCNVANGVEVCSDKVGASDTICPYVNMDDEIKLYKGYYEIYTPNQLVQFRDKVNGGDVKINGRLMNNISMASAGTFTPIGKQDAGGYQGIFDGQDFTIDSLSLVDQEYSGLFSYLSIEGAEVKNIVLNSPSLNTADNSYLGLIVGMATRKASVDNCRVTGGTMMRVNNGEPKCVGGIVGKADLGATVTHCSFQGTIHAMEQKIGGIVGELNSGAVISSCYVMGPSEVWGDDYVGGIVGEIIDDATKTTDCYVNQANGQVTIHVTDGNSNTGLIWGKNGSTNAGKFTRYTEGGLIYEKTGHISNDIESVIITGVADKSKSLHHVTYDIGTKYDYATDSIQNIHGAKSIDFIDCISNIAGTEASKWINIGICDGAFDSNFEAIYMRYTVYAGDDHVMMLRPTDVYPLGNAMFQNCPNAKVYIDDELYADFCADPVWSQYKDHFVSTTSMRKDVNFTEDGVKYAYERNYDATGSIVKKTATLNNSSSNVTMVQVVGCDNSKIANNSGVLKVYKDIGETYNYNTTRILAGTFKDNENIKHVMFEEIMSDARNSYYDLTIHIGDSAFKNCKNLEYFDVVLSSSKDKDHYSSIHAKEMPIGKGVFDGCPNVKIRIPGPLLDEFRTDSTWSEYKDLFVQADFNVTAFTESGVKYSYYISEDGKTYYTNKNASEMESVLTPYLSQIRNFKAEDVLDASNSNTIYYVCASGVDNDEINNKNGELRLYNDIGSYYNYKTIAFSSTGFRNNESIKKIVFEDCASNLSNSNTMISLIIPDGTFQGCKNLKELNLYYLQTDGTNRYYALKPTEIFIGSNVFDGVDENFRIVVSPDYYNDFINDANWSQYTKYIVASEYLPTTKTAKTVEGLTYDYAAKTINTIPTSTISSLQVSYVLTGLHLATVIAATIGTLGTNLAAEAAVASWRVATLISFAITAAKVATVHYQKQTQTNDGPGFSTGEILGIGAATAAFFFPGFSTYAISNIITRVVADAIWDAVSYRIYDEVDFAVRESLTNRLDYLSHRIERACKRATTSTNDGIGIYYTQQRNNIPQMYLSSVGDNVETARIYNDIGTGSDDFHTISVGRHAFHNKQKLTTVEFYDRPDSYQSLSSMQLILPDSCFSGCTNLRTVNLVLSSKRSGGKVALTPDNFILSGRNLFAGCDTANLKILVGRDVIDEFKEDPFWAYYSNCFVAVDVPSTPVKYTEGNIKYGYAYNNNTTPLLTEEDDHSVEHLNVVGGDDEGLKNNNGRAILINDIGTFNSYKVDNIEKNAFKGNENLKSFHFMDIASLVGKSHTGLSVNICDSAFVNCKNFRDLYLVYWRTTGSNNSVSISPDSLRLGKGVFDGCDNLRIKMCIDQEDAYRADTCWNKYSDKFVPCLFAPRDETLYDLLKDSAYVSPYATQTTDHIDASTFGPLSNLDRIFQDQEITSFDEFRAFASCDFNVIYPRMFKGCKELQSITLPNTIGCISNEAFYGCEKLTRLTIPSRVTLLEDNLFKNSGVKELVFESDFPPLLNGSDLSTFDTFAQKADAVIYVPDTVVDLYKEKWPNVSDKIKGISKKPSSFREIHLTTPGTLADSLGLKYNYETQLSKNITIDGGYAQYDSLRISGPIDGRDIGVLRFLGGRDVEKCEKTPGNLKYLDLYNADIKAGSYEYNRYGWNDYVQEDNCVDTYMFYYLDALETLILPRSATKIKKYAVSYCANLKTLVVGDNVTEVAKNVVYNDMSLDYLVMFNKKAPNTDDSAWDKNSTPIKAVVVPKESISDYVSKYGYYHYADTITYGFVDEALTEVMKKHHVYSPSDIIEISDISGWLCNNKDIKNFNELFYTEVIALGDSSFVGMENLEEVSLPANLIAISDGAFKDCSSLHTIWALCNRVPILVDNAFETIRKDFVVYVTEGMAEAFRKAWPQYASHIKVVGANTDTDDLIEVTLTKQNTLAEALGLKVTVEEKSFWASNMRKVKSISGDYSYIKALKVNGPLGGEDIAVLRLLGGRDVCNFARVYLSNLSYLDLYDADIVKEDDPTIFGYNPTIFGLQLEAESYKHWIKESNKIPRGMFRALDNIQTLILPRSAVELGYESCYDMYNLKKLVVGDNMTNIENDALGECNNLKSIVMLCKSKPELDGDAFTDPTFEGDVLKVDHFYVPKSLVKDYTSDTEYTSHANNIGINFDEEATFRALGRHAIVNSDDLEQVKSFKNLFKNHCEDVCDLTMLNKTSVDSVHVNDFSNMSSLQHLSLPTTLKYAEPNAFANNQALRWLDISECSSMEDNTEELGVSDKAIVYVPESFGDSYHDNVVYGKSGNLKCAKYNLTNEHDYDVPKAFTAQAVSFNCTFDADSANTLTLPFTCCVPEGMKAYQFEDGYSNEIHFGQVDTMLVNQPYVIKVDEDFKGFNIDSETVIEKNPVRMPQVNGNSYISLGTLSTISASDAAAQKYMVMNGEAKWNLVSTEDTIDLHPFTSYLQPIYESAPTKDVITYFDDFLIHDIDLYENQDNTDTINFYDKQRVNVHLTRTLVGGAWNTFSVPFDATIDKTPLKGADVIGVKEIKDNCISYKTVNNLKAGQAYLVKPADNIVNPTFNKVILRAVYPEYAGGYDFIGTYSPMTIDNTKTIYFLGGDGRLKLAKVGSLMKGFRAYYKVPAASGSRLKLEFDGDIINAIDDIEVDPVVDTTTAIYSIDGLYMGNNLDSLPSGVYIMNGKKIVK